jgi:hypothetical protein
LSAGAALEEACVTEDMKRHNEFTEALMHELARLWREGERRIGRAHVEEIGERYDVDPDEASRAFVDSRGTLWEGELVEDDGEPGWTAAELTNVPSVGTSTDSSV